MNTIFRCTLLALTTLWLAGCGLKGPLYMPADEPPKQESSLNKAPSQPEQTENSSQAE